MKKIVFLSILVSFHICTTHGQQISKANLNLNKPVKTTATTQNKTTPESQTPVSVYTLTSVRVNIRTGSDNKEFPSQVGVMLFNRGGDGWIMNQLPENMRNEMKSNSNTEFGLEKMSNPNAGCMSLESIQRAGLSLRIFYLPNLFTDAWKIEGVSIALQFKDQNGNLHPTLGNKNIICNNASGFLDASNHIMMCMIDGQFVPTNSSIQP